MSQVLFNAVLENACSEQGARMSAMDSSSRNAGEMLDRLTLTYNRFSLALHENLCAVLIAIFSFKYAACFSQLSINLTRYKIIIRLCSLHLVPQTYYLFLSKFRSDLFLFT